MTKKIENINIPDIRLFILNWFYNLDRVYQSVLSNFFGNMCQSQYLGLISYFFYQTILTFTSIEENVDILRL